MGKKSTKKQSSGAVGGPAASAGLNYQADFAVLNALERISFALCTPLDQAEISMEPRRGVDGLQCWDLRLSPPEVVIEAKLKPKREEVLEWLDRVESGTSQDDHRQFELLYSRGAIPVIRAVESLCRIATEAGGDDKHFRKLVAHERTDDIDLVLGRVPTRPYQTFLRVRIRPFDEETLRFHTDLLLRALVHEPQMQQLRDLLFSKFHKGIQHRLTFQIRHLISEIELAGIKLLQPPTFDQRNLDPTVADAVLVLQACETAVPTCVLAAATGTDEAGLNTALSQYVDSRLVVRDGNNWAITFSKPSLRRDGASVLLGKALSRLLSFIEANKASLLGRTQVRNAIALAKRCEADHGELVACLYWRLDKLLKRTGNKRLVLEIANLSIAAARSGETENHRRGEVVALICGRSWVYQRINRLAEARAEGEKSRDLGKKLSWDRNTAYCLKCLGRLCRMEAEQRRQDDPNRHELLRQSVSYLHEAIALFPTVSDLTQLDRDGEVGDCYSLLGRTYLVAREFGRARDAALKATQLLIPG